MFKRRKISFYTKLNEIEVRTRLQGVTESFNTQSGKYFEGKLKEQGAELLPTFNWSPNNQLRAKIEIEWNKNKVDIFHQLPKITFNLMVFAFIVTFSLGAIMFFFPNLVGNFLWTLWWLPFLWLVITYGLLYFAYYMKLNEAVTLLQRLLFLKKQINSH